MRKHVLSCIVLLLASPVFATIAPVQSQHNWSGSGTSCAVPFTSFPANNDLIVVWTSWTVTTGPNSITASVTDSIGNGFPSAVGPTIQSASNTASQIFYAKNITGGASDTVTVTFSSAPSSSNCVIAEASGADLTNPLDSVSAGYSTVGNQTSLLDSGTLAPANANLLLFGGGTSDTGTASLGTGFSLVQKNGGNITEYELLSGNTALQRATAGLTAAGNWLMQMAVFRDASWTVAGAWNPARTGGIRYADQFPGADIGAKEVAACDDLPTTGGEIYIPAGTYNFSTTMTNCGKNVVLNGAGEGSSQLTPSGQAGLYGTNLVWTGSGGTAIDITGQNVMATVKNLSLDNIGTGAVGIDIDQSVAHVFVEHVTIFPQVDFSTALVEAGNGPKNVVDVNLDDDYFRRSTPGNVAIFLSVNGHLVSRQTRYIGGVVQVGDTAGNGPVDAHFIAGSCEPSPTNSLVGQDCFLVNRVQVLKIDHMYGEFGAKPGNVGYWIDVPPGTGNNLAWSLTVSNSWINGGDTYCTPEPCTGVLYTAYAVNLDFSQADITLANNEWYGFTSPAHVIRRQSAARVYEYGNTVNSSGMDMVDSLGGVTTEINNYSVGTGGLFDDVDQATKQFNSLATFYQGATIVASQQFNFTEGGDSGASSGTDACDGNSTSHTIKCSTNGGNFHKVLIGELGSCSMTSATSCTFSAGAAFSGAPAPVCLTSPTTSPPTAISGSCAISGTTVTITAGATNGLTWVAILVGNPN